MSGLTQLIRNDLRHHARHFVLASIGIIVGIAAFAFFLALGSGVRTVVLGEIFPLDKLEVIPKSTDVDLGPLRMGMGKDSLDDAAVQKLEKVEHVDGVFPKMKLTVPSIASGGKELFGNAMRTEMVADGIDPLLVAEEIDGKYKFEYFDDREATTPCTKDADCGGDPMLYCGDPLPEHAQAKDGADEAGEAAPKPKAQAEAKAKVCRHYVPVIASNHLVEIYNGTIRRAHNLPKLNPNFILGLRFDLRVGASMVRASKRKKVVTERGRLVGFSDRAISLGLTFPLGYVSRYNVLFDDADAAKTYHSIIVDVDSKDNVAGVAKAIEDTGFAVADTGAEQAAMLIAVFMMVFGFVSIVIVGIAAVNIMHVFFMLIYERQREIGIMRAVGASRANIRTIILSEAAVVGAIAGVFGVGLSMLAAWGFDVVSANYIPDFPYKPSTYFEFSPLLLATSIGFAIGFCVLGAVLPARRAARLDPAVVLTGQ
ncbi:MAG: ABC transporter permease [Nannocystaceae bacterium]